MSEAKKAAQRVADKLRKDLHKKGGQQRSHAADDSSPFRRMKAAQLQAEYSGSSKLRSHANTDAEGITELGMVHRETHNALARGDAPPVNKSRRDQVFDLLSSRLYAESIAKGRAK